jgi:hypothetical protein
MSIKFSRAYGRVKMWRFCDVLGTDSVPIFRVVLVFWFSQTTGSVGKRSHLDAAACPRKFCRRESIKNYIINKCTLFYTPKDATYDKGHPIISNVFCGFSSPRPVFRRRVSFRDFSSFSSAQQPGWALALASSSKCRQRPLSCTSALASSSKCRQRPLSCTSALASSSKCRQRPLSCTSVRQILKPSFFAYSSTPSIHLDFGRQRPRWSQESVHNIYILGNSLSSIRTTCPPTLVFWILLTL